MMNLSEHESPPKLQIKSFLKHCLLIKNHADLNSKKNNSLNQVYSRNQAVQNEDISHLINQKEVTTQNVSATSKANSFLAKFSPLSDKLHSDSASSSPTLQ